MSLNVHVFTMFHIKSYNFPTNSYCIDQDSKYYDLVQYNRKRLLHKRKKTVADYKFIRNSDIASKVHPLHLVLDANSWILISRCCVNTLNLNEQHAPDLCLLVLMTMHDKNLVKTIVINRNKAVISQSHQPFLSLTITLREFIV